MVGNEIKQVMVNSRLIGISDLVEAIMEAAGNGESLNDYEIKEKLLACIANCNYIFASVEEAYGKAVLCKFKIAPEISVDEELVSELHIAVLGAGCMNCTQLESDVRGLLS